MKNKGSEDVKKISSIEVLVSTIRETNRYFLRQVQKRVNTALTLRNWIIGLYIVEYEHNGEDKARYGDKVFETIVLRLKKAGLKGMSETNLKQY